MKKLSILFTLLIITFSLYAQVAADSKADKNSTTNISSTIIKPLEDELVLNETEHDFGKIPQGKPVTYVFDVVNNGIDSLKIINVQASCGCTTPSWEKDKIQAPSQKTAITVGYNAASEGPFNKTITITYNSTKTKQIIIKGEVWKTPVTSAPENKELVNLKDL